MMKPDLIERCKKDLAIYDKITRKDTEALIAALSPVMPDDVAEILIELRKIEKVTIDVPDHGECTNMERLIVKDAADMLERQQRQLDWQIEETKSCDVFIKKLEQRIKQLEALLRKAAEGTWWDGNEPFTIQRLESWIVAALAERNE